MHDSYRQINGKRGTIRALDEIAMKKVGEVKYR